MRSLDIRGALRRRWYLLVAGLVVTGGLVALAVNLVGPTHEIKSSVLLLPPQRSVVGYPNPEAPGNPFLRLDGMDPAVSVLVTQLTSKEVSDQMLADVPDGDYEMYEDPLSQAPIIVISATAPTDAQAELIRDRVTAALPRALTTLQVQAGVRSQARITSTDLVVDAHAVTSWRGLVRLLILVVAVGLAGTILCIGVVDAIARSRAEARRRDEPGECPEEAAADEPASVEPASEKPASEEPAPETTRAEEQAQPEPPAPENGVRGAEDLLPASQRASAFDNPSPMTVKRRRRRRPPPR